MALKEYKPETTFPGRMGRTIGESEPGLAGAAAGERWRPPMFCSWCSTTPASAASSAERHRVARSLAIGERQILRH